MWDDVIPDNGILVLGNLDYGGTYVITEAEPPTGFIAKGVSWSETFTISSLTNYKNQVVDIEYSRLGGYGFSFLKAIANYTNHDQYAAGTAGYTIVDDNSTAAFVLYERLHGGTWARHNAIPQTPDSDGRVEFTGVKFGEYYIVETAPHTGYALAADSALRTGHGTKPANDTTPAPITGSVVMHVDLRRSPSGDEVAVIRDLRIPAPIATPNANIIVNTDADLDNPFINEKGSYTITKLDNLYTNTPVAGALFEIGTWDGSTFTPLGVTKATAANGTVTFYGLTTGVTYAFMEQTPAAGYILPPPPAIIPAGGFIPTVGGANKTAGVDGATTGPLTYTQ
jgi:uncharacterized surface anchored protein